MRLESSMLQNFSRRCVAFVAFGAMSACEFGSPDVGPDVVVTDSAGVVIVENRGDSEALMHLRLEEPPLVRLGSEDENAPDFFGRINSAHLDSRGNVWVVDLMSGELKVFAAPSGEHLFTVGGRGEGPGEFRMPVPVGFKDERAWIWDQGLGRLTIFSLDGALIETRLIGRDEELVARLLLRTGAGTFLAQRPQALTGPIRDGMTIQDTVRIWEFEADVREARLIAERNGVTWYCAERMQVPLPFAYGSRFGVGADRVVMSDSDGGPGLDVIEDGELVRRIRLERERMPVTREATEEEVESPVRSESARALLRENLGRISLPEFLPTWMWVRVGQGGHIFALRYGTLLSGEVWDVFDPEGRWLGSISLPEEAHLMDADLRHVVVAEMPELRGPGIAVYRFEEQWVDS
jgi:hypothetical protein